MSPMCSYFVSVRSLDRVCWAGRAGCRLPAAHNSCCRRTRTGTACRLRRRRGTSATLFPPSATFTASASCTGISRCDGWLTSRFVAVKWVSASYSWNTAVVGPPGAVFVFFTGRTCKLCVSLTLILVYMKIHRLKSKKTPILVHMFSCTYVCGLFCAAR